MCHSKETSCLYFLADPSSISSFFIQVECLQVHVGRGCAQKTGQLQEEMRRVCDDILKVKPDLVITEKGVSVGDLAYLPVLRPRHRSTAYLFVHLHSIPFPTPVII